VIVAILIALCLVMPLISTTVSAVVMSAHTHTCHDEEHKEECIGTRECCKICRNFYIAKNRIQPLYGNAANKLSEIPAPELMCVGADSAFSCVNSTSLISLKIRLNN
jgi:hypothetical protein